MADVASRLSEQLDKPPSRPAAFTSSHWPKSSNRVPFCLKPDEDSSQRDGRLKLSVHATDHKGYIARLLNAGLHKHLHRKNPLSAEEQDNAAVEDFLRKSRNALDGDETDSKPVPPMNIVVMVIGSRGDIQPFIRVAMILRDKHNHRVRIATHPAFRDFVEKDCGLEFFSVGGDPSELMAFMVKNPGLMPSFDTLKQGEVGRRREQMGTMFTGFWKSCIEPSDGHNKDAADAKPFVADAIISNPPVMIHVHCAERLGCPLHLMFTFPYSPTTAFPHPLANLQPSEADQSYANFVSYPLVEMMTWTGLGDLINDCRVNELGLDPVSTIWAPGQLYRQRVPFTYMWSPSLCSKPKDWGPEVNIAGYVFLELASNFKPPEDLTKFLEAGEPPIYIGFGSIVVDDAKQFTQLIFDAVEKAGVRAIINKGWGGFGDEGHTPDNIFMIDNVPHDWLFPKCKAVVHHGGAGTTAIGLKCAKPTVIVPFFGDQPFWGAMCAAAKAGAHECVPYKKLTAEKLAESIKECFSDESQKAVQTIADRIEAEGDGAQNAVDFFHKSLPLHGSHSLRESVVESRAAAWQIHGSHFRLSPMVAELMVQEKKCSYKDLRLLRVHVWTDLSGPGGPLSGVGTAVWRTVAGITGGVAGGPMKLTKDLEREVKYRKQRKSMESGHGRHSTDNDKSHDTDNKTNGTTQTNGGKQGTEDDKPSDANAKTDGSKTSKHFDKTIKKTGMKLRRPEAERTKSVGNWPDQSTQQPAQAHDDKKEGEEDRDKAKTEEKEEPEEEVVEPTALEVGEHAAYSFIKPLAVIAQAPIEILLGIGQGLHNAPRLYGDATVRTGIRVSGFKSGMVAAGSEFFYESTDAFLGLFTQPYYGAKEAGPWGLLAGFGKGIGGLVLKGGAAVINPFGLALKGIEKEATKYRTPIKRMREARMAQGREEVAALSEAEREQAKKEINDGLLAMRDLWKEADKLKKSGVLGRWKLYREKQKWVKLGALESVDTARKVQQAWTEGVPVEGLMEEKRAREGPPPAGPDIEQRPGDA